MKQAQKNYDSNNINNIINKAYHYEYYKKNLFEIKKRKSRLLENFDEEISVRRHKSMNNKPNKNKNCKL